jgi:sulfofructose kinase
MVRSSSNRGIHFDCVGLGVNAIDYLCLLDVYPGLDDKVDAVSSSVQGGGPVPTAMVTLAKLGAKSCYVGKVGKDAEGEFIKAQLEKEGVDTRFIVIVKRMKTSRAFVWVDKPSGKRTVVLDKDEDNRMDKKDLTFLDRLSTKFVHLDAREPEINIMVARWAKKLGAEVCLDVGSLREGADRVLLYADHLIVSRRFACGFAATVDPAAACRKLMQRGFKTVVVTVGEEGCFCGRDDQLFSSPGFKVKVVDTTGAGDVFHGAFIYGLLKKWSLKRIAAFANACAALKCRKLGGRAGIPTLSEVRSFMQEFKRMT